MKTCMEVVSYQLKKDASAESFRGYANQLQEALNEVKGFIKRGVFYNTETGVWVEIVEWSSKEAAKEGEAKIMKKPFMMEAMGLIDGTTVQMNLVGQVI